MEIEALRKRHEDVAVETRPAFQPLPAVGELDANVNTYISNLRGSHEQFLPTSRVASYVKSRIDLIAPGNELELIVFHDDSPNAFATPGYVVVNDGLLKILEYQDELDGILAHEYTHLQREHVEHAHEHADENQYASIGRSRGGETEADFIPSIETLDKIGSNPDGLSSALAKIGEAVKKQKEEEAENGRIRDPLPWEPKKKTEKDATHGSSQDRRLNIAQSRWLIDSRNLTSEFTSLPLSPEDLDSFEKTEDQWNAYNSLSPLEKRYVLQRKIVTLGGKGFSQEAETNLKESREIIPQVTDRLVELIDEVKGSNEIDGKKVADVVVGMWGKKRRGRYQPEDYHSKDELIAVNQFLDGPGMSALEITPDTSQRVLWQRDAFRSYLSTQEDINLSECKEIIGQLGGDDLVSAVPIQEIVRREQLQTRSKEVEEFYLSTGINVASGHSRGYMRAGLVSLALEVIMDQNVDEGLSRGSKREAFASIATPEVRNKVEELEKVAESIVKKVIKKRARSFQALNDPYEICAFYENNMDDLNYYLLDAFEKSHDMASSKYKPVPSIVLRPFDFSDEEVLASIRNVVSEGKPLSKQALRLLAEHLMSGEIREFGSYSFDFVYKNRFGRRFGEIGDNEEPEDGQKTFMLKDDRLDESREREKLENILDVAYMAYRKEHFLSIFDDFLPEDKHIDIVDLEAYKDILLQTPLRVKKNFGGEGYDLSKQDLKSLPILLSHVRRAYLDEVANGGDVETLTMMLQDFPIARISWNEQIDQRVRIDMDHDDAETAELSTRDLWNIVAQRVIERFKSPSMSIADEKEKLEYVLAFALASPYSEVLLQVPSRAAELYVEKCTFDEGIEFLFKKYDHLPRDIFLPALQVIIEKKARTLQDFKVLQSILEQEAGLFLFGDTEQLGKIVVADTFFIEPYQSVESYDRTDRRRSDRLYGMEPFHLLEAMLSTSQNDREFTNYMFDRWWTRNRALTTTEEFQDFNVEDVFRLKNKPGHLNYWLNHIPDRRKFSPLADSLRSAYLANSSTKYAILRRVLMGENGVFTDPNQRLEFANKFASTWVEGNDETESGKSSMTQELLQSLFSVDAPEELYLRINPILNDLILKLPESPTPLQRLAVDFAADKVIQMRRLLELSPVSSEERKKEILMVAQKMSNLMRGGSKRLEAQVDPTLAKERFLELFSQEGNAVQGKFTPWDLAITIGEKSGAVGVRMLQLSGQYFDIPEEMRERLMDTYDNQQGQSRLQAYRVLKREAESSPQIKHLLDNMVTFGIRIGGGSLMTVYDAHLKDGSRRAIAVKNPNAEFHVAKTTQLAESALDNAIKANPDNSEYRLMKVLLKDVEQWVYDELSDPNFEVKDVRFRNQNETKLGKFKSGNGRYGILVPQSAPTGTRWVRDDAYIEGKNLTSLEVVDGESNISEGKISREDYQDAVSILTRNYIYQVLDTGLVHSDIHPGNFRITADNKNIAVFDRYNLLELSSKERDVYKGFIGSLRRGGIASAMPKIMDHLFSLPNNIQMQDKKQEIVAEVTSALGGKSAQGGIMEALISLKQSGVHIPIAMTLIGKNLLALERMAQSAGFNNMVEAYKHTATMGEKAKFALMR